MYFEPTSSFCIYICILFVAYSLCHKTKLGSVVSRFNVCFDLIRRIMKSTRLGLANSYLAQLISMI